MKISVIQPRYSSDFKDSDVCFEEQLKLIDLCDESMDIIVLPESCDIPAFAGTVEESKASALKSLRWQVI